MTDLPTPVIPGVRPTERKVLRAVARVEAGQSLNQDEVTALLASSGESSDRLVVAARRVHDVGLEAAGRTGVVTHGRKVTQLLVTAEPTLTARAPGLGATVAPYDPMTKHDGLNAAVGAGRRWAEERRPGSPAVVVPAGLRSRCGADHRLRFDVDSVADLQRAVRLGVGRHISALAPAISSAQHIAAMLRCGDVGGLTHREESQPVGDCVLEGIPFRVRTA
jgi:hypothetical protein